MPGGKSDVGLEGVSNLRDSEVDGGSGRVVRIHAEAHAKQVDSCFKVDAAGVVNAAIRIDLGAHIQTDSCTLLRLGQRGTEKTVAGAGLVTGEVHLHRSSGGGETSLGRTEGCDTITCDLRCITRESGRI